MKEKIKSLIGFGIIIGSIIFTILFIFDIGLNSKYFIHKDFNKAFLARQTGNCEVFKAFILKDVSSWEERCIKEKDGDSLPIKSFSIKEITINRDKAFLQVELIRDQENGYLVNYETKRVSGKWFINQDIKK